MSSDDPNLLHQHISTSYIGAGGHTGSTNITGTVYSALTYSSGSSYGAVPMGGGGTSYNIDSALTVKGSIEAKDVKIDGVSIKDAFSTIQDRLAILVPDPAKLEKFAALKAAYDHYKTLEALIGDDTNMPKDDNV